MENNLGNNNLFKAFVGIKTDKIQKRRKKTQINDTLLMTLQSNVQWIASTLA